MKALFAPAARLPDGWASKVRFEIGRDGVIEGVTAGASTAGADVLDGPVIPGMPNLHSHAFQRAMAGLAEARHGEDDFWSWREAMYRFLAMLSPEDVETIATQLYIEMVKAGYTRVCEFHYLHNDVDGVRYRDPVIMARAHLRAAKTAGIGITLIPTLYAHGGCGGKSLKDSQKRFATTPEQLIEMIQALEEEVAHSPGANVAIGIHSLRAAEITEIEKVLAAIPYRPIHIHVSEQMKEVQECIAWCGRSPVAQLDRAIGLSEQWNLVHATHLTEEEIGRITEARATVTLCPTTEGNLGDGFFPADAYFRKGGAFGIGTDSQICIDPREELRLFEYGRRLNAQKRAISADKHIANSGAWLWLSAAEGGQRPCAEPVGKLAPGYRADFLVLNKDAPSLLGREGDTLIDAFVFATHGSPALRDVYVGGNRVVEFGHHHAEEQAEEGFRRAWERWNKAL